MFILHLFSGARRKGDFQDWAEQAAHRRGIDVVILSIDVVLNEVTGDLQNPHTVQQWKSLILQGKVGALLAGPPCETWSRARAIRTQCCTRWLEPGATCPSCRRVMPRPLRSPDAPWGRGGLRRRERHSLQLGNSLYRTTLELALACQTVGTPWIIEHPEQPDDDGLVSSWRLHETRTLAGMTTVEITAFDQCTAGARAIKPTMLMHSKLGNLRAHILALGDAGRCPHPLGAHRTLRGFQGDGSWRTSMAKTYPAILCRILAECVIEQVSVLWPALQDSDEFAYEAHGSLYQPLDVYGAGEQTIVGRDTFYSRWVVPGAAEARPTS